MNKILEDLLKKRGVKLENLSKEEKETFDRWNSVLNEGDVTVEKIQSFCKHQVGMIENKWKDLDNKEIKNERLIVMHTVYKSILQMIKSKKGDRERLEGRLVSLLHTE